MALEIDPEVWTHETLLDGCYVIKSDVPGQIATAAAIHQGSICVKYGNMPAFMQHADFVGDFIRSRRISKGG